MTKPKFYGFFVGIDAYKGVTPLRGTVNDATRMYNYIKENLDIDKYDPEFTFLFAPHSKVEGFDYQEPTRANMLAALDGYATKVKKGDVFFWFYAGHGCTEKAHPYFQEPSGKLQTMVPMDSRTKDAQGKPIRDVANKEIRVRLRKIYDMGEQDVQIIVVQDSCHSEGATRSINKELETTNHTELGLGLEDLDIDQSLSISTTRGGGEFAPPEETEDDWASEFDLPPSLDDIQKNLDKEKKAVFDLENISEEERPLVPTSPTITVPTFVEKTLATPLDTESPQARYVVEGELANTYRSGDETYDLMQHTRNIPQSEEEKAFTTGLDAATRNVEAANTTETAKPTTKTFNELYPEPDEYIHLYACSRHQCAYEVSGGGVFTGYIIKMLEVTKHQISYTDLANRAKMFIYGSFPQSPSVYVKSNNANKKNTPFLANILKKTAEQREAVETKDESGNFSETLFDGISHYGPFNVSFRVDANNALAIQWIADVGAVHGLSILKNNETIPVKLLETIQNKEFNAILTKVNADRSEIQHSDAFNVNVKTTLYELYVPTTAFFKYEKPIQVAIEDDTLRTYVESKKLVPIGAELTTADQATYKIIANRAGWVVASLQENGQWLEVSGYTQDKNPETAGKMVLDDLKKIAHFNKVFQFKNIHPTAAQIFAYFPIELHLDLISTQAALKLTPDNLKQGFAPLEFKTPSFDLFFRRIGQGADVLKKIPMYISVLWMGENFSIQSLGTETSSQINEYVAADGNQIWLAHKLKEASKNAITHDQYPHAQQGFLKIIVTFLSFDLSSLTQEGIPYPAQGMRNVALLPTDGVTKASEWIVYTIPVKFNLSDDKSTTINIEDEFQ